MVKWMFKPRPSKFGGGISLLFRGSDPKMVNGFIRNQLTFNKTHSENSRVTEFLFESARSAIYNVLVSQGIGKGDEVIVSSFTCEAVTYAVTRAGANVVYVDINDDLTMLDEDVLAAVTKKTKAVMMQNTFGRLGLQLSTIESLRSYGLFIIEDCALAIGSKLNNDLLGSFGDVSFWSLEVSKTVTTGWGGVLTTNNKQSRKALIERQKILGRISILSDLRRLFQLWFSTLMMKVKLPGAIFIWYFMYGSRIFRRSNSFGGQHPTQYELMGKFSCDLYFYIKPSLDNIFRLTNQNYNELNMEADKLRLNCPVSPRKGEFVVAPRFSLIVPAARIQDIDNYADRLGVEVGRWFTDCPPKLGLSKAKIYSSNNANAISKNIINLPCHWTLSKLELDQVKLLMKYISFFDDSVK